MEHDLDRRTFRSGIGVGASLIAVLAAAGCTKSALDLSPSQTITQGYVIDQDQIDQVPVGGR